MLFQGKCFSAKRQEGVGSQENNAMLIPKHRLPGDSNLNCCSLTPLPTLPQRKKISCVGRTDICVRAIKQSSLLWISSSFLYLSCYTSSVSPKSRRVKKDKMQSLSLFLIKETHIAILPHNLFFSSRESFPLMSNFSLSSSASLESF